MTKTKPKKTLAEWEQEKKTLQKKIPKNIELKNEYNNLMKKFNEKDLRFFYFRHPPNNEQYAKNRGVTAVAYLNREENLLKIGFSFCDNQDTFCKKEGKIEALKRLIAKEKFYTETKWGGDSLIDVAGAFNEIEKPLKFKKWKFGFTLYLQSN